MTCALPASTQGTVWANSQAPEALEVGVWNRLSWTGCSTCLFPVHRGLHVTTRFGRLTGFLALRVSFSKHEGTNTKEEREDSTQESVSLAASLRMTPPGEIYTEWWDSILGGGPCASLSGCKVPLGSISFSWPSASNSENPSKTPLSPPCTKWSLSYSHMWNKSSVRLTQPNSFLKETNLLDHHEKGIQELHWIIVFKNNHSSLTGLLELRVATMHTRLIGTLMPLKAASFWMLLTWSFLSWLCY